jgi:NAD(P)-dependent dehydrogenase (short-subunit alcohol dehydrogenase family)
MQQERPNFTMAGKLEGKVALVFGAGSVGPGWGNGKAAAVQFAREGTHVVAVDLVPAAAEETCAIIASEDLKKTIALSADVRKSEEVAAVVAKVVAEFGRVDVLHNNVGAPRMGGPIELSEENWHLVMDINLKSIFLTCKHVLPVMLDQGKGAIVTSHRSPQFAAPAIPTSPITPRRAE